MDKYLDLARELKSVEHEGDGNTTSSWCTWINSWKLWKRLQEWENRGRIKTIQTRALARILRSFPETWGDLLSFTLLLKTTSEC